MIKYRLRSKFGVKRDIPTLKVNGWTFHFKIPSQGDVAWATGMAISGGARAPASVIADTAERFVVCSSVVAVQEDDGPVVPVWQALLEPPATQVPDGADPAVKAALEAALAEWDKALADPMNPPERIKRRANVAFYTELMETLTFSLSDDLLDFYHDQVEPRGSTSGITTYLCKGCQSTFDLTPRTQPYFCRECDHREPLLAAKVTRAENPNPLG